MGRIHRGLEGAKVWPNQAKATTSGGEPTQDPPPDSTLRPPAPGSTHASVSLTAEDIRGLSSIDPGRAAPRSSSLSVLQAQGLLGWDEGFLTGYDLRRAIGHGGLTTVFLAQQRALRRDVAIKIGGLEGGAVAERFRTEARLTATLEHPNIVPVHDAGDCWLAMRRVEGASLHERIPAGGGRGDLPELVEALIQACNAIAYAHSRGIIHRDIKAANIMVGRFGEVLVLDWGLAHAVDEGALADDHARAGTPVCMAPEAAAGDAKRIGPASDVYGLGALLYHVVTGAPPFEGANLVEVMIQARANRYRPMRERIPDAAPLLVEAQTTAMATDPAERPSVAAFQELLRRWLLRSERETEARLVRDSARVHLDRAKACGRREWERAYAHYVLAVADFDKALNLAPDLPDLAHERASALADFASAAVRSGAIFLARTLHQGLRPPVTGVGMLGGD